MYSHKEEYDASFPSSPFEIITIAIVDFCVLFLIQKTLGCIFQRKLWDKETT